MSNKPMKRCSPSLVIRKMHIRTTVQDRFMLTRRKESRRLIIPSAGKAVVKSGHPCVRVKSECETVRTSHGYRVPF